MADDPRDGWRACDLCGRVVPPSLITLHHLVPKQKGGWPEHRRPFCKPCHRQLHATLGNADLARRYPTVEQLRAAEPLQPFLAWIRRQRPDRNFAVSLSHVHPSAGRWRHRWR